MFGETGFGGRAKGEGNKTCLPWISAVSVHAFEEMIAQYGTTDIAAIRDAKGGCLQRMRVGETWSEALLVDFGFSPEEGPCGLIVLFDEGVDVGDEFFEAGEGRAVERLRG